VKNYSPLTRDCANCMGRFLEKKRPGYDGEGNTPGKTKKEYQYIVWCLEDVNRFPRRDFNKGIPAAKDYRGGDIVEKRAKKDNNALWGGLFLDYKKGNRKTLKNLKNVGGGGGEGKPEKRGSQLSCGRSRQPRGGKKMGGAER